MAETALIKLPDGMQLVIIRGSGQNAIKVIRPDGAATKPLPVTIAEDAKGTTFTAVLDETATQNHEALGLMGLRPVGIGVKLDGVRFVVRDNDEQGDPATKPYSSDHPFFAIYFDWTIPAKTANQIGDVDAEASVETVVTTGFSSIFPPGAGGQLRGFQVRIDALGVSTGWVLLDGLFDVLKALALWLANLENPTPDLKMPDWTYEFRLLPRLPLGLAFAKSYLILTSAGNGYEIALLAEELILRWDGIEFSRLEDFRLSLALTDGRYRIAAQLFQAQYPAMTTGADDHVARTGLTLPFGALEISAQAWNITVGFLATSSEKRVCPEIVIELYEAKISSALAGAGPLWAARAVRLHLVGDAVLTCAVDGSISLMETAKGAWFQQPRKVAITHYSMVAPAASASPPPSNPPFSFVGGDFDPARLYMRWEQDNAALFETLRGLVPGLKSTEASPPQEGTRHEVAFELARFAAGEGDDLQARLEWRAKTPLPAVPVAFSQPEAASGSGEPCHTPKNGAITLSLPVTGITNLGKVESPRLQLALPVINVDIQEPHATAMLFFRPANAKPSISLLHIYQFAQGTPHHERVVAHAKLDFSIIGGGGNADEQRQSLPSAASSDKAAGLPLIEFSISPRSNVSAVAVASWTDGQQPKIMRSYRGQAEPFASLLPPVTGSSAPGCRKCPKPAPAKPAPVRLHPGMFASPTFASPGSQWQLAMRIAAEERLISLFDSGSGDNPVKFKIAKVCWEPAKDGEGSDALLPPARIHAEITLKPSAFLAQGSPTEVKGEIVLRFDPADMSLRMVDGGTFGVTLPQEADPPTFWSELRLPDPGKLVFAKIELLGLRMHLAAPKREGAADAAIEFLRLDLRDGRFVLALADDVSAYAAVDAFGPKGSLIFAVSQFALGSGGLDLEAELVSNRLKFDGLQEFFTLETASLSILGNRMRDLRLSGVGKMPEVLDKAPVRVWIDLAQDRPGSPVDIRSLTCMLTEGQRITSDSKRFEFVLSELIFTYNRDAPRSSRRFYFEASGSATFVPREGEFNDGLLANLKSATIEFDRAPISDEFISGLSLMVELRKPLRISLFEVFDMEIRSFGFTPSFEFASGETKSALIIGGQAKFAQSGDVISGDIDFHRLYIGRAASNQFLPEVSGRNLRVAIETAEGFKVGGSVSTIDTDLRKGFKGSGFVEVPGLPRLGAALGFFELRNEAREWKRAWFIAVEASGISYQVPPLPIYLRQVGLGFGYRQTHVLLARADEENELGVGELLNRMLAEIDNYQTLAREESWVDDVEKPGEDPRWTIGLEAVFSLGTTQADPLAYDSEKDRKYRTAILQTLAAIRSDLSLVAAAKLWFPVAYDDLLNNRSNMRARPLARGFLHYAPRQQRLLVHAAKGKGDIYYGPTTGEDRQLTEFTKLVLDPVPFEVTGLIEPSRVRLELGWVDRLVFPLRLGPLKLECRGGMLMALEQDAIINGLYFSARGELGFSASAGGGSLGLQLSAVARVRFAARLISVRKVTRPLKSHAYGEIGIDINVRVSVKAWLRKKIGPVKIRLSISFSASIQVVVALQVGWAGGSDLGFRGRATIVLRVFGRGLRAKVRVGLNEEGLDEARKLAAHYLDSIIEPGRIPPIPGIGASSAALLGTDLGAPLALTKKAVADAPSEEFSLVTIPIKGGKFRLVWIMPTATGEMFYPVPPHGEADCPDYATISGLKGKFYTLNDVNAWSEVKDETAKLRFRNRSFRFEDETAASGSPPSLREMLAGCYVPIDPSAEGDFPFGFKGGQSALRLPDDGLGVVLQDERVRDGPRQTEHRLQQGNPFDDALTEAIEEEYPAEPSWDDKARANQGLLLRAFQSDLEKFAETRAREPGIADPDFGDDPGVFDLGLVLLVEADESDAFPPWLDSRKVGGHPQISFKNLSGEHILRPLVDAAAISFAGNNTRLARQPIVHFDEEMLAVDWKMVWADGSGPIPPGEEDGIGTVAEGNGTRVEDYLKCYRITITDLSGGRGSLGTREVVPANLLSRDGKQLAPRYALTIPTAELFGNDDTLGQRVRKLELRITPVNQWGEEAESFVIIAKLEPRATPLPADQPTLLLEKTKDAHSIRMDWIEPALPNQGGVAATDGWEIVFRRLRHLPYGAFPSEVDAVDEGVAGAAQSTDLRAGDMILRLPSGLKSNPQDDGSEHFAIRMTAGTGQWKDEGPDGLSFRPTWALFLGQGLGEVGIANAELAHLVEAFQKGTSPLRENGFAWQIFIRARAEATSGGDAETAARVSSMGRFLMFARAAGTQGSAAAQDDSARHLPMPHFEWPESVPDSARLMPALVSIGPRHVPVVRPGAHTLAIDYVPAPDATRVMEITWNGFLADDNHGSIEGITGYTIHEAVLDGMLTGERERQIEINSFRTADPRRRDQLPEDLSDTQNWRVRGPIELAAESELPGARKVEQRPYSRATASLVWPSAPETGSAAVPGRTDQASTSSAGFDAQGPANLNPLLRRILKRLGEEAALEGLTLEQGYGHPEQAAKSPEDWLNQNDAVRDPAGWAALWHLGLAVEIALRDPVTGQRVGQDGLLERVNKAIDTVAKAPGEPGHGDLAHLAIDLPVRPQEASAAGERNVASPGAIGLSRIVLMLRPLVTPKVFFWSIVNTHGDPMTLDLKNKRALHFSGGGSDQIVDGATTPTITLGRDDHVLAMARYPSAFSHPNTYSTPLSCVIQNVLDWTDASRPGQNELPAPQGRPSWGPERRDFWALLSAAPRSNSDTELPAEMPETLDKRYLAWSDRFFGLAPISEGFPGSKPAQSSRFGAHNSSTALPDSDTLSELAPDDYGDLRYVRVFDGDLASKRTIAIGGQWRYAELNRTLAQAAKLDDTGAGTIQPAQAGTPVHIPRTRPPAPPQLLRQDIYRLGVRQIHRLGFAEHAEARLTNDNALARERLEYRGTRFRFRRSFLHDSWIRRLAHGTPKTVSFNPKLPEPVTEWQDIALTVERDDDPYLGLVPAIREGGQIVTLPCEPHYYRTDVAFHALARAVSSVVVERQLELPDGGELSARNGAKPLPVSGDFLKRWTVWKDALIGGGVSLDAFARPCNLTIRLPRFSESLEQGAYSEAETRGEVIGNLPDCTLAIQIVRNVEGTEEAICAIRPLVAEPEGKQGCGFGTAFEVVEASRDFRLADFAVTVAPGGTWSDGLLASLVVRPVAASQTKIPDAVIPDRLHKPGGGLEDLVDPAVFPVSGPVAWMGPLLLRLALADGAPLIERGPVGSPRIMRPFTGAASTSEEDLSIALRLLFDAERFAAAKVLGANAVAIDPALAGQVETGAAVMWRAPEGAALRAAWSNIATLKLWARNETAGWSRLEAAPAGDGPFHIIAVGEATNKLAAEAFLALRDAYSGNRQPLSVAQIIAVGEACAAAGKALGAAAFAGPVLSPKGLKVTTQRGNEPRREWNVRSWSDSDE